MKDYSRMFENQPAAKAKEKKVDYSKMFEKPKAQAPAVVRTSPSNAFSNSNNIMDWRRDLSEKVKEHVDLIEALVKNDVDIVAEVQQKLHEMAEDVLRHNEQASSKSIFRFFKQEPQVDMDAYVDTVIAEVEATLRSFKRPNPFKIAEVEKMLQQASYLAEQLAKAGADLEKKKPNCTDDLEVDAINRRCHTLYTQQQLVALGVEQVRKLAMDIKTRPHQVDDLLNATVPMYRMLCLDVLNGTKQSIELRNAL
jgi:hypothetical protein